MVSVSAVLRLVGGPGITAEPWCGGVGAMVWWSCGGLELWCFKVVVRCGFDMVELWWIRLLVIYRVMEGALCGINLASSLLFQCMLNISPEA